MNNPFEEEGWKGAITLTGGWSGAPGRSGIVSLAVIEKDGATSIWQWDDEIYTTPELVASYEGSYAVRSVSKLISEVEEGGICACPIDGIVVNGETEWQSDLLAVAWWRDGEWDCIASPLTSILLTMSDDELISLAGELGSLRSPELLAIGRHIGQLRPGVDSAGDLIRSGLAALSGCNEDQREEALEKFEEQAEAWIASERQRKLARFAGQYELAIELKERELLSEAGCRGDFGHRLAGFRNELEDSIYLERELSSEAKGLLADESRIKAIPARQFDDGFSREELVRLTEFDPPYSTEVRARILRAWAACDSLPTRFGQGIPRGFPGSNTFDFLRWLLKDEARDILSMLKSIDDESARSTVERILGIASRDAERLLDPHGFSGAYGGIGRAIARSRVELAAAIAEAAEACSVPFDQKLSVAAKRSGAGDE